MVRALHRVMSDDNAYDKLVEASGKSFHFMDTLRKKVAAAATDAADPRVEIEPVSAARPPVADCYVVCELIEQRPCVSVHPDEAAATKHAVACAMENLTADGWSADDKLERRAEFETTLADFDRICEGGYEVHVLTPTNR